MPAGFSRSQLRAAGWTQIANFLITGSLLVAFSFGFRTSLRSALVGIWAPWLVGLAGVGLIGAGACVSDPGFGYPSSLPLRVAQFTTRGHLHDLFSMFFFVGIPSACISFARIFAVEKQHAWEMWSRVASIAMIVAFVLAAIGFKQTGGFVGFVGLFQRLSITVAMTWVSSVAIREMSDETRTVAVARVVSGSLT